MRKFSVLLFALIFLGVGAMFGQSRTISGKVVDSESGEELVGVSVEVIGAQTGTTTDIDGKFTVTLPDGYTKLKFEQTSYSAQELIAKDGMVVRLVQSATLLDAAEVEVAMGTKKGKGYVGSAQTVDAAVIEKKSPSDITKALSGEFAGVQVATTSGQPGTTSSVRIRGIASLNASGGALYVVDGIPFGGDVASIDPSDIVSTTVLKDATATAMYGSRGANGVILITTKRGTAGSEGKIEVNVNAGVNMKLLPMHDVIKNPETYMELSWLGLRNSLNSYFGLSETQAGQYASAGIWQNQVLLGYGIPLAYNMWDTKNIIDPKTGKFKEGVNRKYQSDDWEKEMFHNAPKFSAGIKLSGGADKTTYYTSINFLSDNGYYINSDFKRLTALSNLDYSPKKWLTANFKAQYTHTRMNSAGQGDNMNNGFAFVNQIPPIYPVFERDENGNYVEDPYNGGHAYDYGTNRPYGAGINPAGALQYDRLYTEDHSISLMNTLKFEFVKDLVITITNGYNYYNGISTDLTNMFYGDGKGVGHIDKTITTYMDFTSRQQISYRKTLGGIHNLDFMGGHEFTILDQKQMYGAKSNFLKPDDLELSNAALITSVTSSAADRKTESYMAEARYNYDERYFAIVNGSVYGSSYFDEGHRYAPFWSIGGSWNIHREAFMASARKWLSNLKVKASFGTIGNDNIGNYNYYNMYSIGSFGGNPTAMWSHRAQPDLTWETSYKFNTGVEFEILKGRLYGELEFYNDRVVNQLATRIVAPSQGNSSIAINEGIFRNYGVELLLKSNVVKSRNFNMDLRFTLAHSDAIVIKNPRDMVRGKYIDMPISGGLIEGYSIGTIYMQNYLGVNPETGFGEWEHWYDANANPDIAHGYRYISDSYAYENSWTVDEETGEIVKLYRNFDADGNEIAHDIRKGKTSFADFATAVFTGKNMFPDIYGGFGLDISTYGFDFSASFDYIIGGYNYDNIYATLMGDEFIGSQGMHVDMLNAWTKENPNTDVPILLGGLYGEIKDDDGFTPNDTYYASSSGTGTRFLTTNTGLRLSNVRLAYNFPKKLIEKIKLESLSMYIQGDNLFVLSARKGYNPFGGLYGGNSAYGYGNLSTILGGIKLSF